MAEMYDVTGNSLSSKCQCVTFDKTGKILGSCDSLMRVSGMSQQAVSDHFPFIRNVIQLLSGAQAADEPVFYPGLDFRFGEYRSICDFTFMKTTDARGSEHFVWMIYDNSTHYKIQIESGQHKGRRKAVTAQAGTSTVFFRAG